MNYFITGVAGFIGYSLAKSLIDSGNKVWGIDNLNNFYDINLKKERLKRLRNKNFTFQKIDLLDAKSLKNFTKALRIDVTVHLAAQAGVRFSEINSKHCLDANITGTYNLLECLKLKKIKHFIIASSSSVYGNLNKKNFKEIDNTDHPVSLYASSKKSVEILTHYYSKNYNLKTSVLRLFTVYGPWGRPDMAIFSFTKRIIAKKQINLFNFGNMIRDYTYISDVVESIIKLSNFVKFEKICNFDSLSKNAPFRIVNIGNQKKIKLFDLVKKLEKIIGIKAKIKLQKIQKGDVLYTNSNTDLLNKLIDFRPNTQIDHGLTEFYKWYKFYYDIK